MSATTIDKLQVEVTATAQSASKVFQQLEANLGKLKNVLDALNVDKLQRIQNVSNGININTAGMSKAEKDVSKSVSKIKQALAGLQSYADAAMNGDSSAMTSFNRRMTSITSSIDMLKEKLKQLGDTSINTKAADSMERQIEEASNKLYDLKKARDSYLKTGGKADDTTYKKMSQDIEKAEQHVIGLQNKLEDLKRKGMAVYDPFSDYRDSIKATEEELQALADKVHSVTAAGDEKAEPKVDTTEAKKNVKSLEDALKDLKSAFKDAGSLITAPFRGIHKIFSTARKGIEKLSSATNKGFFQFLKYGFGIRSLYVLFRRLRTAVTDSFASLRNSGAFFETTRANLDALKTSLSTLKFQFGAAFEPIFNAVAPALQTLVNYLITVMNVISAFTAKLAGKSTYSKVNAVFDKTASSAGGAGKAVKDLNKQLQGFDELNNLTTNDNKGGGGGGGGGASDAFAQYEEASVDSVLGDFGKELADKIREGDWRGVGQAISDKLSEAMESINWDQAYEKARNFGKGLADFLNGLINPRLFGNVGETIANSLNTAFEFLNSFGTQFEWKNFGNSLGEGLTRFFRNADFAMWGRTVHTWISGILDAGIALIENTDWGEIGTKLGQFLENIDIPNLAKKFATLAWKLAQGLGEALLNLATQGEVGAISSAIIAVLGTVVFTNKLGGIATKLATALGAELTTTGITLGGALPVIISCGVAITIGSLIWKYLNGEYSTFQDLIDAITFTKKENVSKVPSKMPKTPEKPDENGGMRNYYTDLYGLTTPEVWEEYEKAVAEQQKKAAMFTNRTSRLPSYYLSRNWDSSKENKGMYNYYTEKYGLTHYTDNAQKSGLGKTYVTDENGNPRSLWDHSGSAVNDNAFNGTALRKFFKNVSDFFSISKELENLPNTNEMKIQEGYVPNILGFTEDGGNYMLKAWNNLKDKFGLSNGVTGAVGQAVLGKTGNAKTNPISKALETITKKFQTADKTQTTFYNNTQSGSKKSGETLEKSYGDASEGVVHAITGARVDSDNAWADIGNKAKQLSGQFKDGFATLPTDTEKTFKSSYSKGTSQFKDLATWAIQKSNEVSSGFKDMPSNVSGKFGTAYTESTNKWSNTGTWANGVANTFKNAFNDTPSVVSGKFGTAYTESTNKFANTGAWAKGIVDTIKTKLSSVPDEFKSAFENARLQATARIVDFRTWFNNQTFKKTATLETSLPSTATVQNRWNEIANIWKNPEAITLKIEASGSNSFNINDVVGKLNSVIYELNNNLDTAVSSWKAAGMKIKSYSKMAYIQRRAARGGIVDMATPLIAGEAGTEAIVPLQNHTEWLGKMADMMVGEMAKPQHLSIASSITATPYSGTGSSDIAEQNALLREEVQLLRQIANKDLTISSSDVFNATRNESNNYYNRTGNSPFLF